MRNSQESFDPAEGLIINKFLIKLDEEYEEDSIEMKKNEQLFEKFSEPIFYGESKN